MQPIGILCYYYSALSAGFQDLSMKGLPKSSVAPRLPRPCFAAAGQRRRRRRRAGRLLLLRRSSRFEKVDLRALTVVVAFPFSCFACFKIKYKDNRHSHILLRGRGRHLARLCPSARPWTGRREARFRFLEPGFEPLVACESRGPLGRGKGTGVMEVLVVSNRCFCRCRLRRCLTLYTAR